MAKLDQYLRQLKEKGGSDLHVVAGQPIRMRRNGHLEPVTDRPLDDAGVRALLQELPPPAQWETYSQENDLDFAYPLPGLARFRANYFAQERGAAAVFRIIPEKILSIDDLKLPPAIARLAKLRDGLVLVTGPTGSGKSTTLAALIDDINRNRAAHIITIEDPLEFVHQNKKSTVSQREIGEHASSFATALKAAARENPDVVLVGELRDLETVSLALSCAEMGVLVFATLHTNSATKTIDRVIDVFPEDQQDQARAMLASSLAGVVAQLLLPKADGKGRVATHEILLKASGLGNVIREGNTAMLASIMQSGKNIGMITMDESLMACVQAGTVKPEDAYAKAVDKKKFIPLLPADHPARAMG